MLDSAKYVNSIGKTVYFDINNGEHFFSSNDLRDYLWNYEVINNKITSFIRDGVKTKTIDLLVCYPKDEYISKRNELFETFEYDVVNGKKGKLYIGDYYMECFVIGSVKSSFLYTERFIQLKLSLITDACYWINELKFVRSSTDDPMIGSLDHPYDYLFDYNIRNINSTNIYNESLEESDFEIVIQGYCENPSFTIGNNIYSINITVDDGELLVINSMNKTCIVKSNGIIRNVYKYRDRENYIFKKIVSGTNELIWNGRYPFELTVYQRRSEPKWI